MDTWNQKDKDFVEAHTAAIEADVEPVEPYKAPTSPPSSLSDSITMWVVLGLLFLGGYSGYCAVVGQPNRVWTELVKVGLTSRVHRSSVAADTSWLVGEYKDCVSINQSTPVALTCDSRSLAAREMDVRFYGLVWDSERPQEPPASLSWKCKKTNESSATIECRMKK